MQSEAYKVALLTILSVLGANMEEAKKLVDDLIRTVREEEQLALPKCSDCGTSLDFRFNWKHGKGKWWCESCMDKPNS